MCNSGCNPNWETGWHRPPAPAWVSRECARKPSLPHGCRIQLPPGKFASAETGCMVGNRIPMLSIYLEIARHKNQKPISFKLLRYDFPFDCPMPAFAIWKVLSDGEPNCFQNFIKVKGDFWRTFWRTSSQVCCCCFLMFVFPPLNLFLVSMDLAAEETVWSICSTFPQMLETLKCSCVQKASTGFFPPYKTFFYNSFPWLPKWGYGASWDRDKIAASCWEKEREASCFPYSHSHPPFCVYVRVCLSLCTYILVTEAMEIICTLCCINGKLLPYNHRLTPLFLLF